MPITITKYRKIESGKNLVGFVSVRLDKIPSMEINDIAIFDGGNGRGIGFPNKVYEKRDGTTGRQYYIWIGDDAVREQFTQQVLKALDEYLKEHPVDAPPAGPGPGTQDEIPF